MTQDSKKRMYFSGIATRVYSEFSKIPGFDLRIKYIAEKVNTYVMLITYKTNPDRKDREYCYYFDTTEFNDVIQFCDEYDVDLYCGIISKIIAGILKKEARIKDIYD